MQHAATFAGEMFRRSDPGYEQARRAACRNARLPDRYPEVIVQASSQAQVAAAVRLANSNGWRIGVRSGGHSWSCNHVRDGGMLLDISRLDDVAIDREKMRATVGPGCRGHQMQNLLAKQKLFFPVGHCQGVGLGGYLLQGGFGWHSRALGPAWKACSPSTTSAPTAECGMQVRARTPTCIGRHEAPDRAFPALSRAFICSCIRAQIHWRQIRFLPRPAFGGLDTLAGRCRTGGAGFDRTDADHVALHSIHRRTGRDGGRASLCGQPARRLEGSGVHAVAASRSQDCHAVPPDAAVGDDATRDVALSGKPLLRRR